jgi:hypothetical protein
MPRYNDKGKLIQETKNEPLENSSLTKIRRGRNDRSSISSQELINQDDYHEPRV